jgi:starch-binding outer membrane protein, SusD/RagB family
MKRYNKWTYALLPAILVMAVAGCSKFLDRKPLGVGTEDDIVQGGVEGKVFSLYGDLRKDGISGFPSISFKNIRSDDALKGSTPGDASYITPIFDNFQYDAAQGQVTVYWDDHYNFITQCNSVIHDVDSLKLTDPASQQNKAEATFLRALAYFDLVRDFGAVPKIDFKIYKPEDANIAKSSVADIYALIDADLDFASANLPPDWPAKFIGRATKGAANALKAKTLLYRQNWGGALAKAEEVITSNKYSLISPYYRLFKEEGENSTESIFEIQMYVNTNGSVNLGNNHNQVQGVRGSGDWDLGWGFNVPTESLINSYEPNDPRKDATILYSGQSDGGSNTGGYGRTLPPSPPLAQPYWNKKVYTDPARRARITIFKDDPQFSRWLNIGILRYADVLLMAAEAANELGGPANTTKALDYLEQVRFRARNGNNAVLPKIELTDKAQLREAIHRERRAELAMENERFYDLVRWNKALSVLASMGYQARNRYFPLPQSAIDKSGGKLVQNPDYQ